MGASIQNTRTKKTVSKRFPFNCSEPPMWCTTPQYCAKVMRAKCANFLVPDNFRSLKFRSNIREPFRCFRCHFANTRRENYIRRIFEASAKMQLSIAYILVLGLYRIARFLRIFEINTSSNIPKFTKILRAALANHILEICQPVV